MLYIVVFVTSWMVFQVGWRMSARYFMKIIRIQDETIMDTITRSVSRDN